MLHRNTTTYSKVKWSIAVQVQVALNFTKIREGLRMILSTMLSSPKRNILSKLVTTSTEKPTELTAEEHILVLNLSVVAPIL